jgi:hypothetical protein
MTGMTSSRQGGEIEGVIRLAEPAGKLADCNPLHQGRFKIGPAKRQSKRGSVSPRMVLNASE